MTDKKPMPDEIYAKKEGPNRFDRWWEYGARPESDGYVRYLRADLCAKDGFDGFVKMPTSVEEAEMMEKLGFAYIKQHAPHRLTEAPPRVQTPTPTEAMTEFRITGIAPHAAMGTNVPTEAKRAAYVERAMQARSDYLAARGDLITEAKRAALEALTRMQCIIERNTDGGDYKDYETIRAALTTPTEAKRAEALRSIDAIDPDKCPRGQYAWDVYHWFDKYKETIRAALTTPDHTELLREALEALELASNAIMCLIPLAKGYNVIADPEVQWRNISLIEDCQKKREIAEEFISKLTAALTPREG